MKIFTVLFSLSILASNAFPAQLTSTLISCTAQPPAIFNAPAQKFVVGYFREGQKRVLKGVITINDYSFAQLATVTSYRALNEEALKLIHDVQNFQKDSSESSNIDFSLAKSAVVYQIGGTSENAATLIKTYTKENFEEGSLQGTFVISGMIAPCK